MSPASLKRKFPLIPIVILGCYLIFSLAAYAIELGRVLAASSGSTLTVPMPATQTGCPAAGKARPAVMNPLALGKDQNVVFIFNEVPPNTSTAFGHLKRYDVTTKQKTVIVTSGIAIQRAQVSADGQWVLFLSTPDPRADSHHSALFQLVRMDGKGLQTLYCTAASVQVTNIQWSVNQNFRTVTWLDNERIYILRNDEQRPVETLSILDITKNKDIHGGDLQKVTDLPILLTSWSLDSSFDATKLFLGECQTPENSRVSFSNIFVEPAAGGAQHMIYHDPKRCLNTLRVVTSATLLFTDTAPGGNFGIGELWKIKPDGSGLTRLFDNGGAHTVVELNTFTQFPWSNVSRDGNMYALDTHNPMGGEQDLLIGSLSGGKPKVFAFTTPGLVAIVGWTTM